MLKSLRYVVLPLILALCFGVEARGESLPVLLGADTTVVVDAVCVTAIKHGVAVEREAAASTIVDADRIEREGITSVKEIVTAAPNFFIPDYGSRMTSSIYVRGLGTRIDQPVVGMNVDNVPIADKNMYDMALPDIERIEVLRGPQSTLYGRNTMCGVVNVFTLSPLRYQGVRLRGEYGSRNAYRIAASVYNKLSEGLGFSVAGQFAHHDGYFRNSYDGSLCDKENTADMRMKWQYRRRALSIDNTLSFTTLRQGGYPYAYVGAADATKEEFPDLIGSICYNDEASYRRLGLSDGLTVRYDWPRVSLSSITTYQYLNDDMHLDQDLLPLSIFTLQQKKRQHDITEDIVVRSNRESRYEWLCGAFLFYKDQKMSAPVEFLEDGIDRLILANVNQYSGYKGVYRWGDKEGNGGDSLLLGSDFTTRTFGFALYHQSALRAGRWLFTLGLRVDGERVAMRYHNSVNSQYTAFPSDTSKAPTEVSMQIDDSDVLSQTFVEVLPKLSVQFDIDSRNRLYLTASKGYKAGGFNTQMFSEVLQRRVKKSMGLSQTIDVEALTAYRPEKSWNVELGGHFSTRDARFTADVALFWIECFDQQLTTFPKGQTTGRMMTNAGRTRSFGAEVSLRAELHRNLHAWASYGYTNARFRRFVDGTEDYAGNHIPYAPEHTLSVGATYSVPLSVSWAERFVVEANCTGAGRIYWNEANDLSQPFYALLGGSLGIEGRRWAVSAWVRNATQTPYDVFYFASMGNRFLQRGRPCTFGARVALEF